MTNLTYDLLLLLFDYHFILYAVIATYKIVAYKVAAYRPLL